jgi:hypothetical protein
VTISAFRGRPDPLPQDADLARRGPSFYRERPSGGVAAPVERPQLPSLYGTTVRRTFAIGRTYIGLGTALAVLMATVLALGRSTAFTSTFPLELPLFMVFASLAGLLVFTGDRTRGVLEYLIAYGFSPERLFAASVVATSVVVSVALGAVLSVGLGEYLATGGQLSVALAAGLLVYAVPMTYGASLFAVTLGMFWTALSSPRTGINGPLGIAPLLGFAPTLLVLVFALGLPPAYFFVVTGAASAGLLGAVVLLLGMSRRFLRLERLLSPL